MTRHARCLSAALSLVGIAAFSTVVSCTEPDCADIATCATAVTADAAAPPSDSAVDVDAAPPPEKNPYGREYPTNNLGWTPRRPGSKTPGDVIPHIVFEQTVKPQLAPPAGALPIVSTKLADLYDPEVRTHDVIIIVLATDWDPSSEPFLDGFGAMPDKTVLLTALGNGPTPTAPTLDDFERWVNKYSWAWNVLDASFVQLAELQDIYGETYPSVILIDARTMEIAWAAATPSNQDVHTQVALIRTRPPAY